MSKLDIKPGDVLELTGRPIYLKLGENEPAGTFEPGDIILIIPNLYEKLNRHDNSKLIYLILNGYKCASFRTELERSAKPYV